MAGDGKVNATVMVTREERRTLKRMALDRDMTVSDMIRSWMYERLEQDAAGQAGNGGISGCGPGDAGSSD